jgi:hypothetical protein
VATTSGEPEIVGQEVHTEVVFDCRDGDGRVNGTLVDRTVGLVGHVSLRVLAGGHNVTVFDTGRMPDLMDGQTNPFRSPKVLAALRDVLPLVFYTNGKPVFGSDRE